MRNLSIIVLIVVVACFGCSKDKFQTKPQIKIKSVSPGEVARSGDLSIKVSFTDKEGDLGRGIFFCVRERLNQRPLPPSLDRLDTLREVIPNFPDKTDGEFEIKLSYTNFLEESPPDTLQFRIAVEDRAGNKSDTLTTSKVIILQ